MVGVTAVDENQAHKRRSEGRSVLAQEDWEKGPVLTSSAGLQLISTIGFYPPFKTLPLKFKIGRRIHCGGEFLAFFREAVFLQAAVGFVGNGAFYEGRF